MIALCLACHTKFVLPKIVHIIHKFIYRIVVYNLHNQPQIIRRTY